MAAIHIEPTTRCTLACPQCPRTEHLKMVTTRDCDIPNTVNVCKGFDTVVLCGNHGDPIYHTSFHQLITQLRYSNPNVKIVMHTNGAFRTQSWWKTTARLLNANDEITFSIDGLPNNNHLYRVNSQWDSVLTGINTLRFENTDVKMIWKYIVFKHNENEILAGAKLAKQLGFDKFMAVRSYRRDSEDPLTSTRSFTDIQRILHASSI